MGSFLQDGNEGKAVDSNYPLARQSSVFSLTFDEFQTTLGGPGKDFGSMNMEELLRSIWTAEETQGVVGASSLVNGGVPSGNLQRQGSLTLPRTLSQKTVDQVWRDVLKETLGGKDEETTGTGGLLPREPTLGEITLEEFLFRAGVREGSNSNTPGIYGSSLNANDNLLIGLPNYTSTNANANLSPVGQTQQPLFPKQTTIAFSSPVQIRNNGHHFSPERKIPAIASPVNNNAHGQALPITGHNKVALPQLSPRNHLQPEAVVSKTDTLSPSPPPFTFPEGVRGRRSSSSLEKVVERRRRRMIKNRESAARSRARKQAYTLELEAEIAKLKAMNEELQKKQDEYIEMQQNQSMETKNLASRGKRVCLRRTLTGPW